MITLTTQGEQLKKNLWIALWAFNLLILLDIWFNNAGNLVDFLFFITGG
jgi:hypothetical protein